MKKVDTDLQVCLLTLVSSPLIFIYREVKSTPGALVDTLSSTPSVMDNASGLSLAYVLLTSTSLNLVTTSYAIAR